jgi:hypothetical protein
MKYSKERVLQIENYIEMICKEPIYQQLATDELHKMFMLTTDVRINLSDRLILFEYFLEKERGFKEEQEETILN